ncbi:hypothetical protein IFM89_030275 [Coptis chinensis]|uniref:SWIRM domain-containing protein n=1 Tax=Coptis chinensis TaxID=261450 RepID=A0A835ISI6_9MAGN|nr:hypothetical protein IFM89_030275 [Coptis chinensis]
MENEQGKLEEGLHVVDSVEEEGLLNLEPPRIEDVKIEEEEEEEEKEVSGSNKRVKSVNDDVRGDSDDEPIGSLFKLKKSRNPRKVKSSGLNAGKNVQVRGEISVIRNEDLGGMDDTLASFRKKLKGPKVGKDDGSGTRIGKSSELIVGEFRSKQVEESPTCSGVGSDLVVDRVLEGKEKRRVKRSRIAAMREGEESHSGSVLDQDSGVQRSEKKLSEKLKEESLAVEERSTRSSDENLDFSLSAFIRKSQSAKARSSSAMKKGKKGEVSGAELGQSTDGALEDASPPTVQRHSLASSGSLKSRGELRLASGGTVKEPPTVQEAAETQSSNETPSEVSCWVQEGTVSEPTQKFAFFPQFLEEVVRSNPDRCTPSSEVILGDSTPSSPHPRLNCNTGTVLREKSEVPHNDESSRLINVPEDHLVCPDSLNQQNGAGSMNILSRQLEESGCPANQKSCKETPGLQNGLKQCSEVEGIISTEYDGDGANFGEKLSGSRVILGEDVSVPRTDDNALNSLFEGKCHCNGSDHDTCIKQASENAFEVSDNKKTSPLLPKVDSEVTVRYDKLGQPNCETETPLTHSVSMVPSMAQTSSVGLQSVFVSSIKEGLSTTNDVCYHSSNSFGPNFATDLQSKESCVASVGSPIPSQDLLHVKEDVNETCSDSIMLEPGETFPEYAGKAFDSDNKDTKLEAMQRDVRKIKKRRHGDMAYEGDTDWEFLIQEQGLFGNRDIFNDDRPEREKGKSKYPINMVLETEICGAAAVVAGLKARAAGPFEKIKFKEILKRRGGLQEYLECRNFILGLWSKDTNHILRLSDCGATDAPSDIDPQRISLIREIYGFLDQNGYINVGIACEKEKSEPCGEADLKLSKESSSEEKCGTQLSDSVCKAPFILGQVEYPERLTDIKNGLILNEEEPISQTTKRQEFLGSENWSIESEGCQSTKEQKIGWIETKLPNRTADTDTLANISSEVVDSGLDSFVGFKKIKESQGIQAVAADSSEAINEMQCDSEIRKRIIVVGAGPAGLTAARHLQRQVPLELDEALEAEYNSLLDDMVVLMEEQGDRATKMSLEDGLEYALKKRRMAQSISDTEDLEFDTLASDSFDTRTNGHDKGITSDKEVLSPLERRVMNWHFANLEYGCAALLKEVSLPYWNQDDVYGGFGGAHCMIKGGYSTVIESLGKGLAVHLNHVVTEVSYSTMGCGETNDLHGKVKVSTSNGNEFTGDAVLITVPLGCLKANTINFSPSLPEWKQSSIHQLGFGVLNKVVLEFPDVFWDDSVDYFGATAEETDRRGQCFMFWNVKKTAGAPILIALVVGKAALDGQSMSSSDHVNHAVEVLRKLFGNASVPNPVASVVTNWGQDPFSRGAYSYVAVGASGEDYDILGRPIENCLFFAGEATCKEHPDTVGGAMMSGLREAVRIIDILNTGNDYTAEVEAMEAAQRQMESERYEVMDILKRLEAVKLSTALSRSSFNGDHRLTREALLKDMFHNAKTTVGRLHLAKELLNLPVEALKSFAGTKEGLSTLNSWILDSMGKDGTQLLRHCVRLLVRVSTNLLAVRLSGIGRTVKEKVCVHTSRDIRAVASQLVSVWIEVFRKKKAANGGLKLLRQTTAPDLPKNKYSKDSISRKSIRMANGATYDKGNIRKVVKLDNVTDSKSEANSVRSQEIVPCLDSLAEDENVAMSEEEAAAFAAAEAARAAALAAAEAYASSEAVNASRELPKIPSFHKFARREQYAQMDDSDFRRDFGRQDCLSEIDSRNCKVRNWSVDFSAACANLDSSRMSSDNYTHRSHSNEVGYQLNLREHSGESAATDSRFTKAWVDSAGSGGIKDYQDIERWQSQAAAVDPDFYHHTVNIRDEEDSSAVSKPVSRRYAKGTEGSSASQAAENQVLVETQTRGAERFKKAIVDYVASLLMPLYKARKIDKEGYKSIMKKSATKVMEQTTDAEKAMDASQFLDYKRKNKIRAFVDKLIEKHMAMKPS